MTKTEKVFRVTLGVLISLLLALLILFAALWPERTVIGGWVYRRNETVLDLSGTRLRSLDGLKRLRNPQFIDLRGSSLTLEELLALRELFPDCDMRYDVSIEGNLYDSETIRLTLSSLREDILPLFPRLKTLELRDILPAEAERLTLAERYPKLDIVYTKQVSPGRYYPFDSEELDLSDVSDFTLSELSDSLLSFPRLRRLVLCDCGFDNESLCAFRDSHPSIELVWDVNLFGKRFLSTDAEIDVSGQWIADSSLLEAALPCFTALSKVTACNCGISDEDMDALAQRHPDLRFIWEVHFGVFHLRTDTTRFLALDWPDGYTWLSNEQLVPLSYCRDMVALDLGHMWFSDTTFLRDMTQLRWLILADNRIKDISSLANLEELTYLELFLCDVQDISPLLACKNLRHLNLAYCPVKNVELLAQLPNLERLWINGCPVSDAAIWTIRKAHPDIQIVSYGESSTGQGWRKHPAYYEMRDAFGVGYMD